MNGRITTGYQHFYLSAGRHKLFNLAKRLCKQNGVGLDIYEAKTSDSVYFRLSYGLAHTTLRVSNHFTKATNKMSCLILTRSTKKKTVERFFEREIKNIKFKSVKKTIKTFDRKGDEL